MTGACHAMKNPNATASIWRKPVRRQNPLSLLRPVAVFSAGCAGFLVALLPSAEARITALTNCTTTSPYGSTAFGAAGTYQQLACTAIGALDPSDSLNAIIQDIRLAP